MVSDLLTVPVVLVALGAASVYTGWKRRRVHARMAALEPTPIGSLPADGRVEVEGTATPVDDPITAPVSGREAVVAAWTVEEWDERGDRGRWREVARGIESAPFRVDDDTGSVACEPISKRETAGKWTQTTGVTATEGVRIDDALAEFASFAVETELPPDADPPPGIRRLHADHGLYEDTGSVTNVVDVGTEHGHRRYTEGTVDVGESVYVLGRVESDGNGPTVTTPREGPFVVSDRDEAALEASIEGTARRRLVGGAVATVLGLAGAGYLLAPF